MSVDDDDEGGPAAQTGSLTHAGVAEFHRNRSNIQERMRAAWDAISKAAPLFPLADPDEVRLFLTPYMNDPRNIFAEIVYAKYNGSTEPIAMVEQKVKFQLPPHPIDRSNTPIYVEGTFDQLRLINGIPNVFDLKTGRPSAWQMIHDYAFQMAAYTYGARVSGFPTCQPGRLIRAMGYREGKRTGKKDETLAPFVDSIKVDPEGVFLTNPFTADDVEHILETVRFHIGLIRNGEVNFYPGPHCSYCPHKGLFTCTEKFRKSQQGLL